MNDGHPGFLIHRKGDFVGVATQDLSGGTSVIGRHMDGKGDIHVSITQPVPLGHKLSLIDIKAGEEVVEYGFVIGKATSDIKKGEHVHVHNLKSVRW